MKILMVNPSESKLPVNEDLIRADTYISIPLARELIKRNHQVSFLTANDSHLDIPQVKSRLPSLFSVVKPDVYYQIKDQEQKFELKKMFFYDMLIKCQEVASSMRFDLIHFHSDFFLSELVTLEPIKNIPIVITLHSIPERRDIFSSVVTHFKLNQRHFVSISNNQRNFFPYQFASTVYNGVDVDSFQFEENGGHDMLFSGRLRKIKGAKEAILTAVKLKRKLRFVGRTSTNNEFVRQELDPIVQQYQNLITNEGYINHSNMSEFYKKGRLTLFPISWEEPFGLVQVESMACGTPVIAYARGSVPEIIKDGETGFIVNSSQDDIRGDWIVKKTGIEGLCEAVERIYAMPKEMYRLMRSSCRKHVENYFSIQKMTSHYEELYTQIVSHPTL